MKNISDNWIINNLNYTFNVWNDRLAELWQLVSQSPETFKGGDIWNIIVNINGALQAIGYGLLVLFFAMSVFGGTINIQSFKSWQTAFRYFLRFVAAKTAVTYGMSIMTTIFALCNGAVARIADHMGGIGAAAISLPSEIETAIQGVSFLGSIPLWLVTLIGCLLIWVLSILMILTIYGRFFRLYIFTALSSLPLATFAGEGTSSVGKSFIKSYVGVCMEGAIIVICCIIFSAYAGTAQPGAFDATLPAVNLVWNYLGEVVFNMLVLVGLIKASDRVVKELLGI